MGAYNNLDTKIAGLKYGVGYDTRVSSWRAAEQIEYGAPVFCYAGDEKNGYNAKRDVSTITLDADLVTSNVITTTLTIDGVAQTPVATTFATSHDDTMDAHKAALEAAFSGLVVTLTDATDNRQFTLTYNTKNLTVASVVTLGASQAGITIAYTNNQVFIGIALFTQKSNVENVGYYAANETMNVMEKGWIYVLTSVAVNANTKAYVIWTLTNQTKFTNVVTDNYDVNCWFRDTIAAAGLALVEVNGMNLDATP